MARVDVYRNYVLATAEMASVTRKSLAEVDFLVSGF